MKVLFRSCLLVFTVFLFAGCGGGSSDGEPSLTPSETPSSNDGTTNPDTGSVDTTVIRFGSFDGGGIFTAGTIATNAIDLNASESAALTVAIRDNNNNPVTDPADIFFSSPCINVGLSEINPVVAQNTNGTINATYTARGCSGNDEVTAQTILNGTSFSAEVTINTTAAPLGSITFTNAEPNIIGIKNSGAIPEQSVVSFKVTNTSGGPVPNQDVTFELDSSVGGIFLSNAQGITNQSGIVTTTINAGSIPVPVRITATANQNGTISKAVSSSLVITTGIADADSFSVGAVTPNIEGWERDGISTQIVARAADRYNTPVPDKTSIAFQAEGGVINPSCETINGVCSVTFTSQNPRPQDGRVTILATILGEENFIDLNGNGQFDGSLLTANEIQTDLSEPFRDDNENGIHDNAIEPFIDTDKNGSRSAANGNFDGLLCNDNCGSSTLIISSQVVIVLSQSTLSIDILDSTGAAITPPLNITGGLTKIIVDVYSLFNAATAPSNPKQIPPAETVISASTSQGTIDGPNSFTALESSAQGPQRVEFSIAPSGAAGTGVFRITATTPNGIISRSDVAVVQN
jgi:hypothetical protein